MKRLIITIIAAISLISCNRKVVNENFRQDSIIKLESIDTMWLQMEADTQYIRIPANCPDLKAEFSQNNKKSTITIHDSVLVVKTVIKRDSIPVFVKHDSLRNISTQREVKTVYKISNKQRLTWLTVGFIIAIFVYILLKRVIKFL